jgi:hypothetical protein
MNANEPIHSIPYFENPFEGLVPHVKRTSEKPKLNQANNELPLHTLDDKQYDTVKTNYKHPGINN